MIPITDSLHLEPGEIHVEFIRSSGPGGQNINKVATAVQLRFNVHDSPSLDQDVKERLIKLAGSRVTNEGILIIDAKRYRTQEQNREDALQRLIILIRKAIAKPRKRYQTKPSQAANRRRLDTKKKHGVKKSTRQNRKIEVE